MILKGCYDHVSSIMMNRSITFVDINGVSTTSNVSNSKSRLNFGYMSSIANSMGVSGVMFGTGDTEPTLNDYFLSGEMITTVSGSGAVKVKDDDDGSTIESVLTVTNTGENEITIKEVGLAVNYNGTVMLERTVLESPVTIPAGGVGQITYTIRMNYPTA